MDFTEFENDNTKNCTLEGGIPSAAKSEACWLGIDEAGRGPVLGPMVYGTCYSPLSMKDKLQEMGFADSKTLTEEQREEIFTKIHEAGDLIGWLVEILSPSAISNNMLRRSKYNLNELSHDTAIGMIRKVLDRGVQLKEVYVDTVGDPAKYQAKLKALFPDLDITVAKKADATYQIVGAASICAKVARDRVVNTWKFEEGVVVEDSNYGSGYPSDPQTKKFMSQYLDPVFGFPNFVRFSWSTASTIIDDKGVPCTWDDEEDEDEPSSKRAKPANTPSVSAYFAVKPDESLTKKHEFFRSRCLKQTTCF